MPKRLKEQKEKPKSNLRVVGTFTLLACKFKREGDSEWELGWEVNEGDGILLDANGNIVKSPIYDIYKQMYYGFHIIHRTEPEVETIETVSETKKV